MKRIPSKNMTNNMKKILFILLIFLVSCGRKYKFEGAEKFYINNNQEITEMMNFLHKYDSLGWGFIRHDQMFDSTSLTIYCLKETHSFKIKDNSSYPKLIQIIKEKQLLDNYDKSDKDTLINSVALILHLMENLDIFQVSNGNLFGDNVITIGLEPNEYLLFTGSPNNFRLTNDGSELKKIKDSVYYYNWKGCMPF